MDRLAVTAITNFILAGETLFLAGRLFGIPAETASPASFWRWAMLLLGVSALLGGIDHGFLEPLGRHRRAPLQRANWLAIGLLTFCMLMTAATQFTVEAWPALLIVGLAQLTFFGWRVLRGATYRVVVLNYLPVVAVFLAMNAVGASDGAGSWAMTVGLALSLVASAVQMAGVDRFDPLDRDGLYHCIGMAAVVFLFWGGLAMRATR